MLLACACTLPFPTIPTSVSMKTVLDWTHGVSSSRFSLEHVNNGFSEITKLTNKLCSREKNSRQPQILSTVAFGALASISVNARLWLRYVNFESIKNCRDQLTPIPTLIIAFTLILRLSYICPSYLNFASVVY